MKTYKTILSIGLIAINFTCLLESSASEEVALSGDAETTTVEATEEVKAETPKLIPVEGYLQPDEIAIPPKIPGYRLYQVDRNVSVPGVLSGGGTFEVVLPLYVYYPNSKTINLNQKLGDALDSLNVIETELAELKIKSGMPGSRRMNNHMESLEQTLKALEAILREELAGFSN